MTRPKPGKRRNACPICGQQRQNPGLPLTVPLAIPTYWSPAEALAVFELLDEMRDLIAALYGHHLTDATAKQRQPSD